MNDGNIVSRHGVTLVGGGALGGTDLADARALAPTVVAADGGANQCLAAGVFPSAVIGDLDSVSAAARSALPDARFIEITEQDSTDFDKALSRIAAPFVIGIGFTGARLDHTLAVFSSLVKGAAATLILGRGDVIFAAPPRLSLDIARGTRVSLYPLAPLTGRSTGLEWPIEGLALSPTGRIGTSNRATGPVTLEFDQPGCLVLMPREVLPEAIAALAPDAVRGR